MSVLLSELRDLQALALDSDDPNNSTVSDGSCNEQLMELKDELDPFCDDPEINLMTFIVGMKSYLDKKKLCCL